MQIVLDTDVALADVADTLWMVASCKGLLTFRRPASLSGEVKNNHAEGGIIDIQADVATCGKFDYSSELQVATGHYFSYATFDSNSLCTNPGTVTGTPSCGNPWQVAGYVLDECIDCDG